MQTVSNIDIELNHINNNHSAKKQHPCSDIFNLFGVVSNTTFVGHNRLQSQQFLRNPTLKAKLS